MQEQHQHQPLKDAVLDTIRTERVTMRPRWYFVLRTALFATGTVVVMLALLYLASFIIYTSRVSGIWFVPAFGFPGWREFLFSLPWILIVISLLFMAILEMLVKHFAFAWRQPLFYSALGIIALAGIGSYIVILTPFHRAMFLQSRQHRWPIVEPFYRAYGMRGLQNIHPGNVSAVTDTGFRMVSRRGEVLTIIVDTKTRFPYGTGVAPGDAVVVFGMIDDDVIHALGVRPISDDEVREQGRDTDVHFPASPTPLAPQTK